jgi:hypothetical protein
VIRSGEVQLLDLDPVVIDYCTFFSYLDWSLVDRWQAERASRGRPGLTIAVRSTRLFTSRERAANASIVVVSERKRQEVSVEEGRNSKERG